VRSHTFRRDLDHAKKSFYRSANAIFGKVGRAANEEVVVQLIVSKCIPILTFSGPRVGPFGPTYCITLSIFCHLLDSRGEYP